MQTHCRLAAVAEWKGTDLLSRINVGSSPAGGTLAAVAEWTQALVF